MVAAAAEGGGGWILVAEISSHLVYDCLLLNIRNDFGRFAVPMENLDIGVGRALKPLSRRHEDMALSRWANFYTSDRRQVFAALGCSNHSSPAAIRCQNAAVAG